MFPPNTASEPTKAVVTFGTPIPSAPGKGKTAERKRTWYFYDLPNASGMLKIRSEDSGKTATTAPTDATLESRGASGHSTGTRTKPERKFQRYKVYLNAQQRRNVDSNNCADEDQDMEAVVVRARSSNIEENNETVIFADLKVQRSIQFIEAAEISFKPGSVLLLLIKDCGGSPKCGSLSLNTVYKKNHRTRHLALYLGN